MKQTQIVYVEHGNRPVAAFEYSKKKLKIGHTFRMDDVDHVVWYIEETATHRNVRVEIIN